MHMPTVKFEEHKIFESAKALQVRDAAVPEHYSFYWLSVLYGICLYSQRRVVDLGEF